MPKTSPRISGFTWIKMKSFLLLLALFLLLFPAAPDRVESDTVVCRKNKNICSTLLCPLFYSSNGTCYDGKQKCCARWNLKNMMQWFRKEDQQ
ncbi:hypothetical protein JRQ81_001618 [Phrynocephalus forsythii]|uniref:Beta-defensin-like domain-containing protein n=1 Tax=Phrynocephalus forsythii TaxID=171643 RepID=A0A9Q0Y8C5_9SAUR|nr:hypothetical protein JRQ81_001618 [Phrynocephalus forsythii]